MIYLDNAATSRFKPRVMFDSMFSQLSKSANPGRGGHNDSIDIAIKIYEARGAVKELFGADGDYELIFTSGCTEALNLAVLGLLWNAEEGDVIVTAAEHNSVLRPVYALASNAPLDVVVVPPDGDGVVSPDEIDKRISSKTRLVCVTHISNVTGAVNDVGEIGKVCARRGVPLLVDAAQSAGHLKIDMKDMNISMLACAGHKGLHGPQGTGFLITRKDIPLVPIRFGGTGTDSESVFQPRLMPEGFESGTLNSAGIIGLHAGAVWTHENLKQLYLHTRYLSGELLYALKQLKRVTLYTKHTTGVVSFNYSDYSSTDIGDLLNDEGIAVRCGLHCAPLIHKHLGTLERGAVRVGIGYNNTLSDIKALVDVLSRIS